ncbi:MAG: FecR domain-containing protein, partial [Gammaproteobacteria bacterium]|nr:FecR domain-containing protein [Gammaproteobacteria bacterium]
MELDRGGLGRWVAAGAGDTLCVGDLVRVQAFARAALRLPDDTVLRLDQNTTMRWAAPERQDRSLLELLRGIIHVISRDPRSLSFATPFANAGLEGTEFVVEVTDAQTDVTVLEGVVVMDNAAGTAEVNAGERGTAQRGTATAVTPIAKPIEAVRWALYYAPVLAEQLPRPDQAPAARQERDPDFFVGRAAGRLLVGRVTQAREDLDRALALDPAHADAHALQAAIAATLNEVDEAERLAEAAIVENPGSAAALIALSYARQERFDLTATRDTLEATVQTHPENAVAWARLAEARLATGDLNGGREAAQRATSLQPGLAHAHTVLGFARLLNLTLADARQSFETALALNAAAPLAHLGLGLTLIRGGELEAGRREIELAVLLDPNDALARSYVAKAYHEERRGALPAAQLALAKTLNPAEPTPWLYDALRKQAENQPVEALHDLEQAAALNDRQTVYRSRLRM